VAHGASLPEGRDGRIGGEREGGVARGRRQRGWRKWEERECEREGKEGKRLVYIP